MRARLTVPLSPCAAPQDAFLGMAAGWELILEAVCFSEAFRPHRQALAADAALTSRLAGTLLRSLGMAAVALRLPPNRWPLGFEWDSASRLATVLMSPTLFPALAQHLQQAENSALLHVVQQAATALQHLPTACPEGASLFAVEHAHTAALSLLSAAVLATIERAGDAGSQAVPLLLPALPQLAPGLHLSAACGHGPMARDMSSRWALLLCAMHSILISASSAGPRNSPSAEEWLAAVVDLLRALPLLPAVEQLAPAAEAQAAAQAWGQKPAEPLGPALLSVSKALLFQVQPGAHDPELAAAAGRAHEACCRAVQWAASSAHELGALLPGEQAPLLPLLDLLALAASSVAQAREAGRDEPAVASRALCGSCAAHWAAVQAATAAGGAGLLHQAGSTAELTSLAISLSYCCMAGPQAVCHSTELSGLLDEMLHVVLPRLPEVLYQALLDKVLGYAEYAPRPAAHLIACGTLRVIASGLPRESRTADAAAQCRLLRKAAGLLIAVQQAAAAQLAAPEASRTSDLADVAAKLNVGVNQIMAAAARSSPQPELLRAALLRALPAAAQVAAALQANWQQADAAPEQQQAAQLELAQAAAARASCAHLACPNVGATGRRGKLCTGCRVARYCSRACSVADWRAEHRTACRLLAAAREAEAEATE
ncbi:hypothetical protein ABPG75_002839 [Micractinium tetrahymenae]